MKGPCKGSESRWYFDVKHQKCVHFHYGGCLGNDNRCRQFIVKKKTTFYFFSTRTFFVRFKTELACQEACVQEETKDLDICSQPMEPGSCRYEKASVH